MSACDEAFKRSCFQGRPRLRLRPPQPAVSDVALEINDKMGFRMRFFFFFFFSLINAAAAVATPF